MPPELVDIVKRAIERAQNDAWRGHREWVSNEAERISTFKSGDIDKVRLDSAVDSIRSFAKRATAEAIEIVQQAFDQVPPDAADLITEQISKKIDNLGRNMTPSKSRQRDGWTRVVAEKIRLAVLDAKGAVEMRITPLRIRGSIRSNSMADRTTNIYNLTGPNSRVNIQSTDTSTNVVNIDAKQLFAEMRRTLDDASISSDEKTAILAGIDAMDASAGSPSFGQRYAEFMQNAANHVAVFQPFFPALSQLLMAAIGGS